MSKTEIFEVPDKIAVYFLKRNKAHKENVFERSNEMWGGFFVDGELASVIGITQKANYTSFSGSYTIKKFRNMCCGYVLLLWALNQTANRKIVIYANPRFAPLAEMAGFKELQTLKNGTKKMSIYNKGGYEYE